MTRSSPITLLPPLRKQYMRPTLVNISEVTLRGIKTKCGDTKLVMATSLCIYLQIISFAMTSIDFTTVMPENMS